MPIVQMPANMVNAVLLNTFEEITTVYIKQYGPGNLRLSGNPIDLNSSINATIQDGIVQTTATGPYNGWVQYFWEGDLWAISDAAGAVVFVIPSYQFFIDRIGGKHPPNRIGSLSELEGNLSTFRR